MTRIRIPAGAKEMAAAEAVSAVQPFLILGKLLMRMIIERLTSGKTLQPDMRGVKELEQSLEKVETKVYQNGGKIAAKVLAYLQQATPIDTGETRRGWTLFTIRNPQGLVYIIGHDNPDLISWLNYGTKRHPIVARNAKALCFKIGGTQIIVHSVVHPGMKGLGFIDRARNMIDGELKNAVKVRLAV